MYRIKNDIPFKFSINRENIYFQRVLLNKILFFNLKDNTWIITPSNLKKDFKKHYYLTMSQHLP